MAKPGAPSSPDQDSTPDQGPSVSPETVFLDGRIKKMLDERGVGKGGGGGHIGGMSDNDDRLSALEKDVSAIKGSLDWAKIALTILCTVTLFGVCLAITIERDGLKELSAKVDKIQTTITDEFRAQRSEQAAQISAIAGAVTASKSQAPQVILIPSPLSQQTQAPSTSQQSPDSQQQKSR